MTTPAYQIRLHDLRQLVGGLVDTRRGGRLADLRQLVGGLVDVGVPEPGVGSVLTVPARVPALSTTGTVALGSAAATKWEPLGAVVLAGSLRLAQATVELPIGYRYTPGPARNAVGETWDRILVTDALGAVWDFSFVFDHFVPSVAAASVAIGEDGIAGAMTGEEIQWAATGGEAPYTWELVESPTGGSVTSGGLYTAGPAFGWDRLKVTDALGAIAYATVQVDPMRVPVGPFVEPGGARWTWGERAVPYAYMEPVGGTAPHTVVISPNVTGATLAPSKPLRASFRLADNETGDPIDCTGWTGEAAVYSQRGTLLASGLAVTVDGELLEAALPDPATLPLPVAVVRVTAHPTTGMLAVTNPDLVLEMLLSAEET